MPASFAPFGLRAIAAFGTHGNEVRAYPLPNGANCPDLAKGSPVKLSGGVISHVLNELDVSCLPKDLPEFIEVDLSGMTEGASFHVSDLKLPAGVTAVHAKDNPTIAVAVIPRGAKSDTAAEGEKKE